jgi:uncharacterized protein YlxW (UPF0749 family)
VFIDNPFAMVVAIVLIVSIASIFRARHHGRRRGREDGPGAIRDDAETARLRDEVRQLKERVQVLERITVEKENSLERQIEQLRDR